jgi:hypothetical protein
MPAAELYGVLAEFDTPDELVAAAKQARAQGYRDLDAFTPFPVHELADILELRDRRVLWLGLLGGIAGLAIAMAMQIATNFNYPINTGGRPLYAISAFAVIAFELTILFAALTPAIGMLALNGLPRLNHPVFAGRRFHLASRDRFFLCVLATDRSFDAEELDRFLRGLGAKSVELVPQ